MNLAVTIARKADDKWVVLDTPNTPASVQRRNFRHLVQEHIGTYTEIRVLTSSQGQIKKRRLRADGSPTRFNIEPLGSESKKSTAVPPPVAKPGPKPKGEKPGPKPQKETAPAKKTNENLL